MNLCNYLPNYQQDIAKIMIQGKKLHVKAIHEALMLVRQELELVRTGLAVFALPDTDRGVFDVKHMGVTLARTTALLVGLLDALIICSAAVPSKDHSFHKFEFDDPQLKQLQKNIKDLRSPPNGNLDFFALANFWKHYFPYNLLPIHNVSVNYTPDYYIDFNSPIDINGHISYSTKKIRTHS